MPQRKITDEYKPFCELKFFRNGNFCARKLKLELRDKTSVFRKVALPRISSKLIYGIIPEVFDYTVK